jgi:large subunit ribosomal protein L24
MGRNGTTSARRTLKVRSGDEVQVVAGKDRGKRGRVLRVDPQHERVYVEGLNMVKRHMRPQQVADTQRGQAVGGVIEREGPIHASNVMLIDPKDGKPTRVGVQRESGRRYRVAKRSGTRLD